MARAAPPAGYLKKKQIRAVFWGNSSRSVTAVTSVVVGKVILITVLFATLVHTGHTSNHADSKVLHRTALLLIVILISVATLWVEGAAGPLARVIEQNFVALSLGLLIPLLMPWLK